MAKPVLCKHKRFDGAGCVLNADHVENSWSGSHGYALRPAVSEETWNAAKRAREMVEGGSFSDTMDAFGRLLEAVEKEMKR
jgi:hypothetical protein